VNSDQKLKIAVVCQGTPDTPNAPRGGVHNALWNLLRALKDYDKINIRVICNGNQVGRIVRENQEGIPFIFIPRTKSLPTYIDYLGPSLGWLNKVLKEEEPDIVHFQSTAWWAQSCKFPYVLTIHGIAEIDSYLRSQGLRGALKKKVVRLTEGKARKNARNLIAISSYTRTQIGEETNVRVIHNPIAPSFFCQREEKIPGRVLVAGMITPLKNVLVIIQAAKRLALRGHAIDLRIAGWGLETSYGQKCLDAARAVPPPSKIEFLGGLSSQKYMEQLARAELLIVASQQENSPMVIAEAMAAGTAVLAHAVGGIPEMVTDGLNGRLFHGSDEETLANTWERMYKEDDLAAMGRNGHEFVSGRHAPSIVAQKTVEFYGDILSVYNR
jgi:glycosyltransferase involved in cell wall biosynthesis